jgi:hypothetical protein
MTGDWGPVLFESTNPIRKMRRFRSKLWQTNLFGG